MFWVKLDYIFKFYCILLMVLVWIIVLCLIISAYKEEKLKENKKYDINHKTIKDIEIRKRGKEMKLLLIIFVCLVWFLIGLHIGGNL